MFSATADSKLHQQHAIGQIIHSNYRQQQGDKEREIPQTPL